MRLAPMLVSILLLPLPGCALFASAKPIVTGQNVVGCSSLIPNSWRTPVSGVDLPAPDGSMGAWISAFDGQTGRLDQANGRTADGIAIVENCEARDRAAVAAATKPKRFLGLF